VNKDHLAVLTALVSSVSDASGNKAAVLAGQCFWHCTDHSDRFLGKA